MLARPLLAQLKAQRRIARIINPEVSEPKLIAHISQSHLTALSQIKAPSLLYLKMKNLVRQSQPVFWWQTRTMNTDLRTEPEVHLSLIGFM